MAWWNSATANWRKFRQLSGSERRLLLKALLVLPLLGLGLRGLGFRRLQARLARGRPPGQKSAAASGEDLTSRAYATARMVQTAARRGPYRARCLPQSLALWWLLRRQGIDGDLRLGVSSNQGGLEAHAWVEYRGQVLDDGEDVAARFAPFPGAITAPPV